MKKMSLNFINRMERAIFKNFPENYTPVSAKIAASTIIAAFTSIVIIFVLQMINADPSSASIVLSIAFGLAFLFSAYVTYKAMECLPSKGSKVALSAYALLLFVPCSFLFIWLAVWAVTIALVLLVVWIILKVAFPSSGGKKKGIVYHRDGTTENIEEDGKGICGETYYKGDKGGTYVD